MGILACVWLRFALAGLSRQLWCDPRPDPWSEARRGATTGDGEDSGVGVASVVQSLPLTEELSAVFARVSGLLLSEATVSTAVGLVTSLARGCIPGAAGAGVTLVDERGGRATLGASDPAVEWADSRQYELDEGPCLTAWAQRAVGARR